MIFFRGEAVLTGHFTYNSLPSLGHIRPFGMNSRNSKTDHSRLNHDNVVPEPPLLTVFFFLQKMGHPTHKENLGAVTDFGDPNTNIEGAELDKSPGVARGF